MKPEHQCPVHGKEFCANKAVEDDYENDMHFCIKGKLLCEGWYEKK